MLLPWRLSLRTALLRRRRNHLTGLLFLLLLWRLLLLLRHAGEDDLLVSLLAGCPGYGGEVGGLKDNLSLLVGVGKLGEGGVLLPGKGGLLDDVELGLEGHLLTGHSCRLLLLLLLLLLVLALTSDNVCYALYG